MCVRLPSNSTSESHNQQAPGGLGGCHSHTTCMAQVGMVSGPTVSNSEPTIGYSNVRQTASHRRVFHNNTSFLNLHAWRLSPNSCRRRDFINTFPKLSPLTIEHQLQTSINQSGRPSSYSHVQCSKKGPCPSLRTFDGTTL